MCFHIFEHQSGHWDVFKGLLENVGLSVCPTFFENAYARDKGLMTLFSILAQLAYLATHDVFPHGDSRHYW